MGADPCLSSDASCPEILSKLGRDCMGADACLLNLGIVLVLGLDLGS